VKPLATSRSTLWLAKHKGKWVVLKTADIFNQHELVQELKHEAEIFRVLESLQGKCIPRLCFEGYIGGVLFALGMNYVGEDLSNCQITDANELEQQAVAVLKQIHSLGVLHGDIRKQNIVISKRTKTVFFVDFGLSQIVPINSPLWKKELQN
jgi:tRNA A-37 threonylcarbamoyl transferase component Bud32